MLFIVFLRKCEYAPRSIAAKLSAVSMVHKLHNFPDPANNFLIKKAMRAINKTPSTYIRLPISLQMLHQMAQNLQHTLSQIYQQRMYRAMFLLAFHAFLRVGEMTTSDNNLAISDIHISDKEIIITFRSFKHSDGQCAIMHVKASHCKEFCPVKAMKLFIEIRGLNPGPLFIGAAGRGVSRRQFSAVLTNALKYCGANVSKFNTHSFRIGAASFWASQGASETQIRLWGRWRSDAFKSYIRTINAP